MNGAILMSVGEGLDPQEWNQWRGGIDSSLDSMVRRMGNVETKIDELPEKIEERIGKLINGPKGNPGNSSVITFRWVVEKLSIPIMLAVVSVVIAMVFGG